MRCVGLERAIPGSDLHDGMGCYPLFCCHDWKRLPDDVAELTDSLVTLTLVTDPFGDFSVGDLHRVIRRRAALQAALRHRSRRQRRLARHQKPQEKYGQGRSLGHHGPH